MYQLSAQPQTSTQRLGFYFSPTDMLVGAGKVAVSSSHTGQTGSGESLPLQVWEHTGVSAQQPGLVGTGDPLLESWHDRERLCKSVASVTWSALQRETFALCINKCTCEKGRERRETHQIYLVFTVDTHPDWQGDTSSQTQISCIPNPGTHFATVCPGISDLTDLSC